MSVRELPRGVIKLISSTQVIYSVSNVVKELFENSVDANASVVDIKLENYGLGKIEVRDNGRGISSSDIYNVCLPNYTSKIYSFEDLERLQSYGFRGEALNSICAISQVCISTKTESDEIASTYSIDNSGTVRDVQASHQMQGTTVTISNLFNNVPVRRKFYENSRKAVHELKKIERVVRILSIIHPRLRVTITHNRCLIWHKTSVNTLKQSFMQVYPHVALKSMEHISQSTDDLNIEIIICKRDCNYSVLCQPVNEAILFYVNKRPVQDKKIVKVVVEELVQLFQTSLPHNKCPLTLISIQLPPVELDVNLEPDKSKVFIRNHETILKEIRECIILHFYNSNERDIPLSMKTDVEGGNHSKKRKMDLQFPLTDHNYKNEDFFTERIMKKNVNLSFKCVASVKETICLESQNSRSSVEFPHINSNSSAQELELSAISRHIDTSADSITNNHLSSYESGQQLQENLVDNLFQSQYPENEIYSEDAVVTKTNVLNELVSSVNIQVENNKSLGGFLSQNMNFLEREFNRGFDEKCNGNDQSNSNFAQSTLSQWSKGHILMNNKHMVAADILSVREPNKERLPKTEKRECLQSGRQTRPQVANGNHGISFTEVASELAVRCRNLPEVQKVEFVEKAKISKVPKHISQSLRPQPMVSKQIFIIDTSIETIKGYLEKWKKYKYDHSWMCNDVHCD